MDQLNIGDVPVMIDGEQRVLKPTLRAISMISTQFGGIAKARDLLIAQDFNATVAITRHGLNLSDKDAKALPEQIFATGLTTDLLLPLIRYLAILANGGKPPPDDPVDAGDDGASTEGNG